MRIRRDLKDRAWNSLLPRTNLCSVRSLGGGAVIWLREGSEKVVTTGNKHSSQPYPHSLPLPVPSTSFITFLFLAILWLQLSLILFPATSWRSPFTLPHLPPCLHRDPGLAPLSEFHDFVLVKPQEYSVPATQLGKLQPQLCCLLLLASPFPRLSCSHVV